MALLFLFCFLSAGCSSLPKNIPPDEYNSVRDYISISISGMPYIDLYEGLRRQAPSSYGGNKFENQYGGYTLYEYNDFMRIINNTMNLLTREYEKTGQEERFYTWAVTKYDIEN